MLQDVLHLTRKHINGYIYLNDPGRKKMEMPDMIRWVGVLLISSLSDITFDKALEELALRDCNVT